MVAVQGTGFDLNTSRVLICSAECSINRNMSSSTTLYCEVPPYNGMYLQDQENSMFMQVQLQTLSIITDSLISTIGIFSDESKTCQECLQCHKPLDEIEAHSEGDQILTKTKNNTEIMSVFLHVNIYEFLCGRNSSSAGLHGGGTECLQVSESYKWLHVQIQPDSRHHGCVATQGRNGRRHCAHHYRLWFQV